MELYIAEKPSVAQALAQFMGGGQSKNGYIDCGDRVVSHCVGHLFEQSPPDYYLSDRAPAKKSRPWRISDLPIIPAKWNYVTKPQTREQLNVLKALIDKATLIVNCADADREGSLIVDQLIHWSGSSAPVRRLWITALDDASIRRGLSSLRDNQEFASWTDAAIARHRADWLIGINLTRVHTLVEKLSGGDRLLTVGRVQTPTLALVVARDNQIENFQSIDHFTVDALASHDSSQFVIRYVVPEDGDGVDDAGRLRSEAVAEKVCQEIRDAVGVVSNFSQKRNTQQHPLGLSLADLTLIASQRYGYDAQTVSKGAQALYEQHRLVSYPRTDCSFLPESQHGDALEIIAAILKIWPAMRRATGDAIDSGVKARIFDDSKVTAHHAIVPTAQSGDREKLFEVERRLYAIIAQNYLAQFMPLHNYIATAATVTTGDHVFEARGKRVEEAGWKGLYRSDHRDSDENASSVPLMTDGDTVNLVGEGRVRKRVTKPPKRFTDGTLVKAMQNIHRTVKDKATKAALREGDGIGTSATRAAIISDLKKRKFLSTDGIHLLSTLSGRDLISTLPEAIKSPVLTAKYERQLMDIQNGSSETTLDDFVKEQVGFVASCVGEAIDSIADRAQASSAYCCLKCEAGLTRRRNKKGAGYWWSCRAYPDCTFTANDVNGKPCLAEKAVEA